ncbi:hypothetical protein D3C81_1715600 [compost metagenome]
MTPFAVPRRSPEINVVVVGVLFRALVIQRHIDIALPDHIFHQWLGLDDLPDTRQFDGLGLVAICQDHLALFGGLQGLGFFTAVGVLLDQQLLLALQRLDLVPVDRDGTGVVGLDQQLAAIEYFDLATQAIPVLEPDRVGERRQGNSKDSEAQQDSGQHKQ